ASFGINVSGSVEDIPFILNFAKENKIDLVVIGPEVPLCMGLADTLEENGFKVFGPRQKAAMLEGSKAFSKEFMIKHNIPTAKYVEVNNYDQSIKALDNFSYPLVIKADGLAAGKGVVIVNDEKEAKETLKAMLVDNYLSGAGKKVVIEEFLKGFECSLLCFTDGESIIPMVSAKDHKQIFDGNLGPNTGGMGTVSPNPFIIDEMDEILKNEILTPFLEGLKKENIDYRGVVFIGLMIENNKPKVLEFNVRFGDPETQSILLRLDTDLFEIMQACSERKLKNIEIKWKEEHAGCLVLASKGYPSSYPKGLEIKNLDMVDNDIIIFHAGTAIKDNKLVTNGGRLLNICALGKDLNDVRKKIYKAANIIDFEGKQYRSDIGLR
ncbi:MAG: phosphoribosylamine--glycine ligase, partial [Erysipelotrichaceae bacterium]|nr:phosphoribosylamine--glycine ligase [Erysipelotrichaceae bacterium]